MTNLEKRVDQNKIEDRLNTQISHKNMKMKSIKILIENKKKIGKKIVI